MTNVCVYISSIYISLPYIRKGFISSQDSGDGLIENR